MKTHTAILVVDDNADVRELTRRVLEIAGYDNISEAYDGLDGLRMLRRSISPVVVLCDYHMPRLNGMQLIGALTSDVEPIRQTRCILMTGDENLLTSAQHRLLRHRAIPVLRKPFDLDELVETVGEAAAQVDDDDVTLDLPARAVHVSGPLAP
jgi:two-component system chemotaxis response regulator CheY